MASLTATGRVGKDAVVKDVGDNKICEFSLAVDQRVKGEKQTLWLKCGLWGERGSKLAQYLTSGSVVEVTGEPFIRAYESKSGPAAELSVRVDRVSLHGGGKRDEERPAKQLRDDVDSDPVPF